MYKFYQQDFYPDIYDNCNNCNIYALVAAAAEGAAGAAAAAVAAAAATARRRPAPRSGGRSRAGLGPRALGVLQTD